MAPPPNRILGLDRRRGRPDEGDVYNRLITLEEIVAAGGGGGGAGNPGFYDVAYVDPIKGVASPVIGDQNSPFLTIQAALDALAADGTAYPAVSLCCGEITEAVINPSGLSNVCFYGIAGSTTWAAPGASTAYTGAESVVFSSVSMVGNAGKCIEIAGSTGNELVVFLNSSLDTASSPVVATVSGCTGVVLKNSSHGRFFESVNNSITLARDHFGEGGDDLRVTSTGAAVTCAILSGKVGPIVTSGDVTLVLTSIASAAYIDTSAATGNPLQVVEGFVSAASTIGSAGSIFISGRFGEDVTFTDSVTGTLNVTALGARIMGPLNVGNDVIVDLRAGGYVSQGSITLNGSGRVFLDDNNVASASPTVNDDKNAGWARGSLWFTTTAVYGCVDSSPGAAIWIQFSGSAAVALPLTYDSSNSYLAISSYSGVVMTNVAARSVTLPTAPADGFSFTVKDGAGTASSAPITVFPGGPDTFDTIYLQDSIASNNGARTYVYNVANSNWSIL